MRVIAAILASGLTAAVAAAAGTPCDLASIRSCADTNQLVWSKSFQPALETFLGKRAVTWLGEKPRLPRSSPRFWAARRMRRSRSRAD